MYGSPAIHTKKATNNEAKKVNASAFGLRRKLQKNQGEQFVQVGGKEMYEGDVWKG